MCFSAGDCVHSVLVEESFTNIAMLLEISEIYWYMKSYFRSCVIEILKINLS